jgi:hypothetical protein
MDSFERYQRVWAFFGTEQVACEVPIHSEQLTLEVELLIEYGNIITGLTLQDMSQRLEGR